MATAVALQFNNSLRILAHDNPHLTLAALNAILWASVLSLRVILADAGQLNNVEIFLFPVGAA